MKLELRYSNMGHRLNGILFFFFKLWFYLKGRERERERGGRREIGKERKRERGERERRRERFFILWTTSQMSAYPGLVQAKAKSLHSGFPLR